MKFYGSFSQLEKRVAWCDVSGFWNKYKDEKKYQFRAETGEILNWWLRTKTVNFQGKAVTKILEIRYTQKFVDFSLQELTGDSGAPASMKRAPATKAQRDEPLSKPKNWKGRTKGIVPRCRRAVEI